MLTLISTRHFSSILDTFEVYSLARVVAEFQMPSVQKIVQTFYPIRHFVFGFAVTAVGVFSIPSKLKFTNCCFSFRMNLLSRILIFVEGEKKGSL
jgi:hypothetical protein